MTKPIQNPQSNIQDINNYKVKIIIESNFTTKQHLFTSYEQEKLKQLLMNLINEIEIKDSEKNSNAK